MNLYRYVFIVLAVSFGSTLPYSAYSKEIPFRYTYTNDVNGKSVHVLGEQLLVCAGPFARRSKVKEISAGLEEKDIKFYSAEVSFLSPYGKWTCCTYDTDGGAVADLGCPSKTGEFLQTYAEFHLYKDDEKVDVILFLDGLNIEKDSDDSLENDGRKISTFAALGDDPYPSSPDHDTFRFHGTEGDNIVIWIENDPAAGHIGKLATLTLRDAIHNVVLTREIGSLPLEVAVTLPESGEYNIVVSQFLLLNKDKWFRGNYFLHLDSSIGNIDEIHPSEDVEK